LRFFLRLMATAAFSPIGYRVVLQLTIACCAFCMVVQFADAAERKHRKSTAGDCRGQALLRPTLSTSLKIADSQIQSAIEDGASKMVIDLTDVEYVDSAGLGMLMYAYGMPNEKQGSLRLCGVTARVMSLLQMTKTDMFLSIDKSLDESLAAL
jgi:anti-anti-sigma factor